MSSTQMVVMTIVLIILVACALGAWSVLRRRSLRDQFGSEYDRVIAESETRLAGEHVLRDRQRRHSALEVRELSPQVRAQYTAKWRELQVQFIDSPTDAVNAADDLVTRLVEELGYPTGDYDKQVAYLSVDHATTLQSYREAHEISMNNRRGEATTEQLRLAVVHFRALVARLLGEEPAGPTPDGDRPDEAGQDSAPEILHPRTGEVHV
jgi:hypothetical protein